MREETDAIVCSLRSHGEHGAVVRLMTPAQGLVAAYVRGARGRRLRPVLIAGNLVRARLRSRSEAQLPQAEVELVTSRGPLLREPLPAAAIEWVTALTATALPEGHPYPRLYAALDGLLAAIDAAPSAAGWGAALVQYEAMMLAELGFGLDLSRCAVTDRTDDLVAVSPRTGRAVSAVAAHQYSDSLLPLPRFLLDGGTGNWEEICDGLNLTGHFLARDLLNERAAAVADGRARLVDRIKRAGGMD